MAIIGTNKILPTTPTSDQKRTEASQTQSTERPSTLQAFFCNCVVEDEELEAEGNDEKLARAWRDSRVFMKRFLLMTLVCLVGQAIGGAIFNYVEVENERELAVQFKTEYDAISTELQNSNFSVSNLIQLVQKYGSCAVPDPSRPRWTFAGSCFYATSLFTTIGYGSYAPTTDWGRFWTCCYGIGGIIIFGFFLAETHKLFMRLEAVVVYKYRDGKAFPLLPRLGGALGIALLWIMAHAAFAVSTNAYRGWAYGEGVYYAVITLSTIGLGDYTEDFTEAGYLSVACWTGWIMCGLSVLAWCLAIMAETTKTSTKMIYGATQRLANKEKEHRDLSHRFGAWRLCHINLDVSPEVKQRMTIRAMRSNLVKAAAHSKKTCDD